MTNTQQAARLLRRALRLIPKDIEDMKQSDFIRSMQWIDDAMIMLKDYRPKPVQTQFRHLDILDIMDKNYPKWKHKRRVRDINTIPRHCAMYVLRKYTAKSLKEIGILCTSEGCKRYDHTTVMNGVKKVRWGIETNDERYLSCLSTITTQLFNYDNTTNQPLSGTQVSSDVHSSNHSERQALQTA